MADDRNIPQRKTRLTASAVGDTAAELARRQQKSGRDQYRYVRDLTGRKDTDAWRRLWKDGGGK